MQESKNIRTNKCINYFARRSGVSIGIMAMNYAGKPRIIRNRNPSQ